MEIIPKLRQSQAEILREKLAKRKKEREKEKDFYGWGR